MTDMRPFGSTSPMPPVAPIGPDAAALKALAGALRRVAPADGGASPTLRARIAEVGRRAEALQLSAGMAAQAAETLARVEEALVFAFEAADEVRSARSLPIAVISGLQIQIDLAVWSVGRLTGEASFAGRKLFDGGAALDASGAHVALPRLSSECLGAASLPASAGQASLNCARSNTDYSRSIASAVDGGPNSLECCAEGAADILRAAARQVRSLRDTLTSFYRDAVMPAANDLAVTVSNALASEWRAEDMDKVSRLLDDIREQSAGRPSSAVAADNVLRLLD